MSYDRRRRRALLRVITAPFRALGRGLARAAELLGDVVEAVLDA
jgi:hypothetical protein